MSELLTEDRGAVRILTMNRPDKHNALNTALTQALLDGLTAADQASAVHAVVLIGAGRSFCAGADTSEFSTLVPDNPDQVIARANLTTALHLTFSRMAKPVVAATGYGYGGGKPKKDAQPAPVRQVARHVAGPVATLPGFEMLPDGGSRLFVDLSQSVPVEERKAPGSVTYVLKGAHLEHRNNANALVTVHFNTPVWRAKLVPSGADLLFVVEMRSQAAQGAMKMTPGAGGATRLTVDFAKGEYLGGGVSDEATQKMMTGKGGAQ